MAVGTYLIKASDLTISHHAKLEYKEERHKFLETRRIEINGIILDDQRASRLLIDGKKSLHGLPLIMTIETGVSITLENPLSSQTQLVKNVESQVVLPYALGHVSYEEGSIDTELSIEFPEGLYGYAIISSILFNDLWNIAKAGSAIKNIFVDVFGARMVERNSIGKIEYAWEVTDENDFCDLNISSFEYSF